MMRQAFVVLSIFAGCCCCLSACANNAANLTVSNNFCSAVSMQGNRRAEVSLTPALPGENHLFLSLKDAYGKPLKDVSLQANQSDRKLSGRSVAPGLFELIGIFPRGPLTMNLIIHEAGHPESLRVYADIPTNRP